MIGQAPDSIAFRDGFPWPDVVIPVEADGSDVIDVLDGLDPIPRGSLQSAGATPLKRCCVTTGCTDGKGS